jgi:hypothetical protein
VSAKTKVGTTNACSVVALDVALGLDFDSPMPESVGNVFSNVEEPSFSAVAEGFATVEERPFKAA